MRPMTHSNKRWHIAVVTMLTVLLLAGTMSFTFARTQQQINNDIQTTQQKINETQQKTQEMNQKMADLQSQINETKAEADKLAGEVASLDIKVVENQKKLEKLQEELDEESKNLDSRLRNMYKNGTVGFVDVILSSGNVMELIDNVTMVARIYTSDKEMVATLQDHYDETEEIQVELESQKAELNNKMVQLKVAQEQLYGAYEQIGADKATVEAETASLQSKMVSLRSEVAITPTPAVSSPTGGSGRTVVNNVPANPNGANIVAFARQYVGCPYVYGGNSLSNGCDCSGFTRGVYGYFGIGLPRTSEQQRLCGTEVSITNRQAGDLMWYPGHVGIYAGNGMMVHASMPGVGIVYEPVYSTSFHYIRLL